MSESAANINRRYSYGDYAQWSGPERWELIDGVPHLMSPAPSRAHQEVVGRAYAQLLRQLEGHRCCAFVAPLDVRLPETDEVDEDIRNVVQPDVVVVCDQKKLDSKGVRGAPD
jgi:Uma2 family endonuclease